MSEEEASQWWNEQPFKAIIYGVGIIVIASIAKLAYDWITIPLPVNSFTDLYNAVGYSFSYVLNFEFKLWWVFLLIIYYLIRFNKND